MELHTCIFERDEKKSLQVPTLFSEDGTRLFDLKINKVHLLYTVRFPAAPRTREGRQQNLFSSVVG